MSEQKPAEEIWATLAGPVNEAMVQRIFQTFVVAITNKVKTLHVLLQSTGGFVGDGIAIYNFVKNIPIEVIFYNGGFVQSIAVVSFLGAKKRKASANATFMIHRAKVASPFANSREHQAIAESVGIDDSRMNDLILQNTSIPVDKWKIHDYADLHFTAQQALEWGVIDEIADFKPPLGQTIFNVLP